MRKFTSILLLLLAPFAIYWQTRVDWPTQIGRKPFIDVRSCGATGDGSTDDTAAIQECIDEATASIPFTPVYFPAGKYAVSSIDVTDKGLDLGSQDGLKLFGASQRSTSILGFKQTVSRPVFDFTGTGYFTLENLQISGSTLGGQAPPVKPSVVVLISSSTTAGTACTKINLEKVWIGGWSTHASLYVNTCTNNSYSHIDATSNDAGARGLVITKDNVLGVTSPYTTILDTTATTGDHNFFQPEIHGLAVPMTVSTILLEDATSVSFTGGVYSSSGGPSIVEFQGTNREISWRGGQLESEAGGPADDIFYNNAGTVRSLILDGIEVDSGVSASGGVIAGADGAVYQSLYLRGRIAGVPGGASVVKIDDHTTPATVVIDGGYVEASGLPITPGASIRNTIFMNPGAITLPATSTGGYVTMETNRALVVNVSTPGDGLWVNGDGSRSISPEIKLMDSGTVRAVLGLALLPDHLVTGAAANDAVLLHGAGDLLIARSGTQIGARFPDSGGVQPESFTHSALPSSANGTLLYCSDCQLASPCTSGGTGALAKRIAAAWVCN